MDPRQVQAAREAGDPVIYGDAGQQEILEAVGLENCSVLVISFADPNLALRIIAAVRALRPKLPILVRTQDDAKLDELQQAGATEVVPETLEASLMLASHLLLLLNVPVSRVVKTVGDIRGQRYAMMRGIFRPDESQSMYRTPAFREELQTVVLPPGHRGGPQPGRPEPGQGRGHRHRHSPRWNRRPAARCVDRAARRRRGRVVRNAGGARTRRGQAVDGMTASVHDGEGRWS